MILQKGSLVGIIGGVIAVGILVIILVVSGGDAPKNDTMMMEDVSHDGDMMLEDGAMMEEKLEAELPKDDTMMMEEESVSYAGEILAGNASAVLLDFNQADYEKALAGDVPVFLYFYAKWCPSCRAEVPKMAAAFNDESAPAIIGFRVNYKDKDTDDFEKGLASEFGIGYQHTKVALINGERVLKSPEQWETSRYLTEFNNLAQ